MEERSPDLPFEVLVEHARRALIRELGACKVDVWLGKDGVVEHDVEEVAAIVIRSLERLIVTDEVRLRVEALHRDGLLAPPLHRNADNW